MTNKTKIICIVLALLMIATMFLTGCKDADKDNPESSTPVESLDSSEDVSEETSIPDSSDDSSEDISDETSDISEESSEDISDESSEEIDSSEPDSSETDEPVEPNDSSVSDSEPDDSSAPVEEPDESEVPDDSSAVVCNHNYISTITPATCLSAGKTEEKCSLCGDVKSSNAIAALGHDYKTTQSGNSTVKTCQRCGDTKTETTGSCNGNHSYAKVKTVPATCQAIGYTEYKCSKCGAVDKRDVTDQLFHDYQFTKTVAPTATTEGYDLYTCTLCGHGDKRFVKPATGGTSTGYSCGVEGHVCESAEVHEVVMTKAANGCPYCASTSCPVFFENSDGWVDYTHCPEYDVTKDPDEYCQTCHLPYGDGPGYCDKHLLGYDKTCERCNQFVPGGSCHHCTVAPNVELVTFTFNANGGSLNGFPETIVAEKGESVNVYYVYSNVTYPMPTRNGYEFWGWVTNPNETDASKVQTRVNSDKGLVWYAYWHKIS